MLAALLRRASGDAEMDGGPEGQHFEVIGGSDASIEKDVLREVARQKAQHLTKVGVILFAAEELRAVRHTNDKCGIHFRTW